MTTADARMEGRQDFIAETYPAAQAVARESGLSLDLVLAQAALESNWGERIPEGSNNLFALRADGNWQGALQSHTTPLYIDGQRQQVEVDLRAYDSVEAGLRDWVDSLRANPRIEQAGLFTEGTLGNFAKEAQALHAARYVTDAQHFHQLDAMLNSPTMQSAIAQAKGADASEAMSITAPEHPANELYRAVGTQLAQKGSDQIAPETVAEITVQAMQQGITSPAKLLSVDVADGNAYVRGADGVGHVVVDLAAPVRSLSENSARALDVYGDIVDPPVHDVQRVR